VGVKRLPIAILIILTASIVFADRWYAATALDIEGNESGYSNTVQWIGPILISITFEWTPNSEPDISGYHLFVKDNLDGVWTLINIDIYHLDHCLDKCQKTLKINNPIIQLKGEIP
jgi:hypothetical protein